VFVYVFVCVLGFACTFVSVVVFVFAFVVVFVFVYEYEFLLVFVHASVCVFVCGVWLVCRESFLAVQWLGFLTSKGTKMPHAVQHGQKKVGVVCIR